MNTPWKYLMLAILLLASTLLSSKEQLIGNDPKGKIEMAKKEKQNNDDDDSDYEVDDEENYSGLNRKDILTMVTSKYEGKIAEEERHCTSCAEKNNFLVAKTGECVKCLARGHSRKQLRDDNEMYIKYKDKEINVGTLPLNLIEGRNDGYSILQVVYNIMFCTIAFYELVDINPIKTDMNGGEYMDKLQMLHASLLKLTPAYYLYTTTVTLIHMFSRNWKRGLVALKVWPHASVTMYFSIAIFALLGYFWGGAYTLVNFGITLLAVVQQCHLWLGNMGFMSTSWEPSFVKFMMMQPHKSFIEKITGEKMSQAVLKKIMDPSLGFMKQKMKFAYFGAKLITIMCFSAATSLFVYWNKTNQIGMDPLPGRCWILADFFAWLLMIIYIIVSSVTGQKMDSIFTWNSISVTGFMGVMMGMESVTPMTKVYFTFGTLFLFFFGIIIKDIKKDIGIKQLK